MTTNADHGAPLTISDIGGCTCARFTCEEGYVPDPDCRYHLGAAAQPWNHGIPWNCPTYWDGCNCNGGPFYTDPPHDGSPA